MSAENPPSAETDGSVRKSPAFKNGLAIGIATGLYGISFGALSVAAGLSVPQTVALSLLMFTGGSQFAFIGVLAGGGSGASAFGAATLLGIRNTVYGMQINALISPRGWRKVLAAHITIDESTANAVAQEGKRESAIGFWVAGLGVWVFWTCLTLVGALAGSALGDTSRWGLDGAAVAAFIGLLWPRLKQIDAAAVAVVCGLVTAVMVPLLPPGLPIIAAAAVAALLGWMRRRTLKSSAAKKSDSEQKSGPAQTKETGA